MNKKKLKEKLKINQKLILIMRDLYNKVKEITK